jgi:ferritin-like metal-binding protein YciE
VLDTPKKKREFLNEMIENKINEDKKQKEAVSRIQRVFKRYKGERKRFKGSIGLSILIHKADDIKGDFANSDKFISYIKGSLEFVMRYIEDDEIISYIS